MVSTEILSQEKGDTKEAQTTPPGDTHFDKLENILKNKIPNEEKKYNKFLKIFQNIKKQEIFSEDKIYSFIENTKINLLDRQIGPYSEEDQNKIVLEKMDMFFGGIVKTSETKEENTNIKAEVINTKTEVINTNTEVTNTNAEVINTNTEVTNTNAEVINTNTEVTNTNAEVTNTNADTKAETINTEKRIKTRQATQESYNKLDKKDKITDEQLQQEKAKIPHIVIDAVNKKTQGTELKTDDFLKFYLIGENKDNKNKPEYQDFIAKYLELKTELEIPEETSFNEASNPETVDRLVEGNKGLNNFANTSETFDSVSAPSLPEIKDFDTEFETYVKFIPDETTRKKIEKNKDIIKAFKSIYDKDQEDARNEEGKKAYEEYMDAITEIKENLPKRTAAIIKQRVLGTCITGLATYFDTTTINKENFANDFDINTQEGFQIQKGKDINEQNDDILYINGNIQGNTIGFYYNLTNTDAQLQSDDFLNFDGITETFAFGRNTGGKKKLGVQLPTITMLSSQAQGVSEKNFTTLLQKSTSEKDFETSLKETISSELLKNYGQEALVKSRVERDIEKNIITQTLHTTFIPEVVATEMSKEATNKTTKTKARKLLEIWDKSTENMGASELRTLRSLIQRLDPLIGKEHHENLEHKREKLLGDMEEERGSENYDDQRGTKTLKFFRKFSKDKKINLEDLGDFISSLEKNEGITENISQFSPDFQTKETQEEADDLLKNIG